ncbi:hypothetical protein MRB53_028192 [Persea americana]|uniref:Uncharacterized protein n=1 Tax=Persea americana TaxID=3435 RepID=A0ACC2KFI0_PERAE|nr:hypothetical protein MRB53_028192 [Persea americana]
MHGCNHEPSGSKYRVSLSTPEKGIVSKETQAEKSPEQLIRRKEIDGASSPTFEAIYGRTSSLILLGQLKEVPKLYQGGKSDECFYHLYKARSTLMLMLEQEKFAADEFKLFINDAWNDVFELQQAMHHHHRSVGDCLRELKVLAENVDGSTSWDSVSMREKALKIMNIANILKHFQRKVRKLVEDNEISDAGSEHSSVGLSEVKENFKTYKRARLTAEV